jgi:hypothetical protein
MVKIVRGVTSAAGALAMLVCLAGCNFGVGIFPDRLMSYEAFVDLSRFIDPDHVWNYEFQIIRDSTSGAEYLVLANDDGSWGDDCIVVFNSDLKVLGHFTMDQLDAMDSGNPFSGRGAMVDAAGCIVVGNRRFSVSSRGVKYLSTPPTHLSHYGLAIPEAPDPNIANISGLDPNLRFDRYTTDWVFMGPMSLPLSGLPSHEVLGAWLTATDVLLVVRHDPDPDTAHVLKMNDLMFATGGLTPPLLSTYGNAAPFPSQSDIEWDTLGYTNDGFAAFRRTTNQYYLFNEFGIDLGVVSDEIAEEKRPWNQRHVYGRTSGWYIMDPKEMSLERRAWWWK